MTSKNTPVYTQLVKLKCHLFTPIIANTISHEHPVAPLPTICLRAIGTKGVKQFAETGSKAGIQPEHANRLRRLLSALDAATCPANMNAPGYALHPLKGDLEGHWAVRVSGNWRLTFAFEGEDAILVDYQDYH